MSPKDAAEGESVLDDLPYDEDGEEESDDPVDAVDPVEDLVEAAQQVQNDLAGLERERDEYLEGLKRVQAEFENYRKRVMAQQADHVERAAEGLVEKLLPVLDAFEAALQHSAEGVEPIYTQLLDT